MSDDNCDHRYRDQILNKMNRAYFEINVEESLLH